MRRYFDFTSIKLVQIDCGAAKVIAVSHEDVEYLDGDGMQQFVDLKECARVCSCLKAVGQFPPADDLDWGAVVDAGPGFYSLSVTFRPIVGLRGALDAPPWFQFLDRARTQFEFRDYDHIKKVLLDPLAMTRWLTWDAC
jgi:hypothetical protein